MYWPCYRKIDWIYRVFNPKPLPEHEQAIQEMRERLLADSELQALPQWSLCKAELEWQQKQATKDILDMEAENLPSFLDTTALDAEPVTNASKEHVEAHCMRRFLNTSTIVRYLRARDYNIGKVRRVIARVSLITWQSFKLLRDTLLWRAKEQFNTLDMEVLDHESCTGKMRLAAERDRHNRPILILDNTVCLHRVCLLLTVVSGGKHQGC